MGAWEQGKLITETLFDCLVKICLSQNRNSVLERLFNFTFGYILSKIKF